MNTRKTKTTKPFTIDSVITFFTRYTPYFVGIPILCVMNLFCYEENARLLQPITNILWLGIMTMFWFKYYK